MGRPFIDYSEEDADSLSSRDSQEWLAVARAALAESGSDENLDEVIAYLGSLRRPAWKPNEGDVPEGGLKLFDSKIGGLPYLLPDEEWPTNNGETLMSGTGRMESPWGWGRMQIRSGPTTPGNKLTRRGRGRGRLLEREAFFPSVPTSRTLHTPLPNSLRNLQATACRSCGSSGCRSCQGRCGRRWGTAQG